MGQNEKTLGILFAVVLTASVLIAEIKPSLELLTVTVLLVFGGIAIPLYYITRN